MMRNRAETLYRRFQAAMCERLEGIDGDRLFVSDIWERSGGGGGDTRILEGGTHIEKAAVNVSVVHGDTPPGLSERLAAESSTFFATGVSMIVHPRNPHAPTFHANLRYFETDGGAAWFGGGADMTPVYLYDDDAVHFHTTIAGSCRRHEVADYPAWKRACDEYFHLPHRAEARGVGGVFFDHLTDRLDDVLAMQEDLAGAFMDAYLPVLERRITMPFDEHHRAWQEFRRGRYAEFNLVWDRGTRFGLETGGRTESILASLPPVVRWRYDHRPEPGSPEAALMELVTGTPREWADFDSLSAHSSTSVGRTP